MITIFGIPGPLLFGQLLLGLINGAFYAMLSLGLAVIFGMLNIINFAHGALFMMGAFASWMLLNYVGIGYFPALILAPLLVGIFGIILEKTIISRLYKLDHLYGLLLTFGLSLVIEGLFRNAYGSSGMPYRIPPMLQGADRSRLHVHAHLSRLGGARGAGGLHLDLGDHREDLAGRHAAGGDGKRPAGAGIRRRRAAPDHPDLSAAASRWRPLPAYWRRRSTR